MKKTALVALVALGLLPSLRSPAQDAPAEGPRNEVGRYFARPLDLWKSGLSYAPVPQPAGEAGPLPSRVELRENVWAQPIRTPDGTWMIYVPPKSVLDFLESPSEETAKAYLRWKQAQAGKLKKAMELLAQVKEPSSPAPPPDAALSASSRETLSPAHEKITYFRRPSCPHCASQDAVLAEWLRRRSGATLDIVLPEERPELWKAYAVRGTPTLVIQVGRGREEVLVGLQSQEALDASLARLTPGKDGNPESPRKEIPR